MRPGSGTRDYIAPRTTSSPIKKRRAQPELYFRCELLVDEIPDNGPHPDNWQVSVDWLDLSNWHSARLYPKAPVNILSNFDQQRALYIGDVN